MNDKTQMNGGAQPPTPDQIAQIEQAKASLNLYLSQVISTTFWGIVTSNRNIPPTILLSTLSGVLGTEIGKIWAGDEAEVLRFRNVMQQTFSDALHKVPIEPPRAKAPTPPAPAPKDETQQAPQESTEAA